MNALLPFILPIVCLFWMIAGLLGLLRAKSAARKKLEHAKKPSVDSAKMLWRIRIGAGFWFLLGLAGLVWTGLSVGMATNRWFVTEGPESQALKTLVLERAQQARKESAVVGMVVAAVADGQEVIVGVGQVGLGSSVAPDADTVYEIGSISKVVTGTLLAQAIERGELSLETRIADLLPDGVNLPTAIRDQVTVRHLTTHSSGFPRLPANFATVPNLIQIVLGGDPHREYDVGQFHEALRTVELEFSPGERSSYSNFAVSLLGHLLATRAGQPYEELMQSRIARPLGMSSTVVNLREGHRDRLAQGYRAGYRVGRVQVALKSATWDMPEHYAGAGGVRSTAKDMLVFLKANMGLVDTPLATAISESHRPLMQTTATREIGMNWLRLNRGDDQPIVLWHNGGTGGYRTFLGFTEDGRFGVVVLASTAVSMDDFAMSLLDTLRQDN